MSDIKCPFCQQELEDQWVGQYVAHEYFDCPKCKMNGNPKLWHELMRTRKALEAALAELQEIDGVCDDNKYTDNLYVGLDGQDTRNIALDVKKTITQIKDLQRKDK